MKNVLVISTSLRPRANSDALADAFARGAREAGASVEQISLKGKRIGFCQGCLACQKTGRCALQDDANEIVQKMLAADALAFATPVYYYEMSGQMKTLLDRANPIFPLEYASRRVYLLAAAADAQESAMDGAVTGLRGWIDCFERAALAGVVRGVGVNEPGEIEGAPALREAYALGRAI